MVSIIIVIHLELCFSPLWAQMCPFWLTFMYVFHICCKVCDWGVTDIRYKNFYYLIYCRHTIDGTPEQPILRLIG